MSQEEVQPTTSTRKAPAALNPLLSALLCAIVALAVSFLFPRGYRAGVTLYFPSVNTELYRELTEALRVDALDSSRGTPEPPGPDGRVLEVASTVLHSRAALESTLSKLKLTPPSNPLFGDAVEAFRSENVGVTPLGVSSLRLSVLYSQPENARAICAGLLDYYSEFIAQNPVTNTARVRLRVERQLRDLDKKLRELESKLVVSADPLTQLQGDATIQPDPAIMRQLWQKRLADSGNSRLMLDKLRQLRAQNRSGESGTPDPVLDWQRRWGPAAGGSSAKVGSRLPSNVRKADLPTRLLLERNYEENLTLYQAAVLQYSFLTSWGALQDFSYQILDPIAVETVGSAYRPLWFALGGALAGLLLAGLVNGVARALA